jgi:hypothetical protein
MGGATLLILNLKTVINLKESRYVMNNIGPVSGDSLFKAFVNPTKVPPAPVNTDTVGDSNGVVPKGNDSIPDEFLSSSAGNTAVTANAGLMPKPKKVKDTDSNNFWSGVGAVEEKTEGEILSPLNTKEAKVSLVPVVLGGEQAEVKKGLIGAMNGGSNDPLLLNVLTNV